MSIESNAAVVAAAIKVDRVKVTFEYTADIENLEIPEILEKMRESGTASVAGVVSQPAPEGDVDDIPF